MRFNLFLVCSFKNIKYKFTYLPINSSGFGKPSRWAITIQKIIHDIMYNNDTRIGKKKMFSFFYLRVHTRILINSNWW